MIESRGNWPDLVEQALAVSSTAAELAALSEEELPGLVDYLAARPELPFQYLSVHAPSKGRRMPEAELVSLLQGISPRVDSIVVHPDILKDLSCWTTLGRRLVIENMDARKPLGQTADDLARFFDALPEARLCLDVAHASVVDRTMAVALELLDRFGPRLRHLHVSSLDSEQHHVTLTAEDEARFAEVLDRCRDVPWILEASPFG